MSFKDFFRKKKSDKSPEESWAEKRAHPRVHLYPPDDLAATVELKGGEEKGSVHNISLRGCALVFDLPETANHVDTGATVTVKFFLRGHPLEVQAEFVRKNKEGEGAFRFRPPFPKDLDRLQQFLEPRFLGASLREINPEALQDTTDGRWFQGVNETNLFSWENASSETTAQRLIFLEKTAEWDLEGGVKTGRIETDSSQSFGMKGSDLIQYDPAPQKEILQEAALVVRAASIDSKVKNVFLEKILKEA